ncbi:uncharacterized protein RHIMIDRAFT_110667 [Rhizopus microsporus ATCC 52813]|uniref:OTU domain-containing protein n=1 Tax=Rhizopus microsporus ATCC 52813 TaxID=1340429 RepID=A0A2G4SYH8_RHIZD|nr:uncharacterized protein RHIMIDRAFT_110667 [Rhizopus microsporus ATCC 52813]PHZ13822.1 hypothetical protein RHIMIDRAFT_110667 [Rhizopus microsporus ATCC 52813]
MEIKVRLIDLLNIKDTWIKKMELILNSQGDGNCSFRCIVHVTYGDENLRMRVKQDMKE